MNVKNKGDDVISQEIVYPIDDWTYLTIEKIVNIKNFDTQTKLETSDVIANLFSKVLKMYIADNEDLLYDTIRSELNSLERRIEGDDVSLKDLFTIQELLADSKNKAMEGD